MHRTRQYLFLTVLLLIPTAVYAQWSEADARQPLISVNGEAVVYVQPDTCVITLGIETRDAQGGTAQAAVQEGAGTCPVFDQGSEGLGAVVARLVVGTARLSDVTERFYSARLQRGEL